MPCPICDQKPMNCDCSETERRQFCEIEELQAKIERLESRSVISNDMTNHNLARSGTAPYGVAWGRRGSP